MNFRIFSLLLVAVIGTWMFFGGDLLPPSDPSPLPVSTAPDQQMLASPRPLAFKDYQLMKVASYSVTARVLSHDRYYFDKWSGLSPVDLALGWGLMSNKKVISQISVSQGWRFYHWSASEYPIPAEQIASSSANTHIIPATKEVARTVKSLHTGQFVSLAGYLVNVTADNGSYWNTSLSRSDEGDGACEIFFVETARAL